MNRAYFETLPLDYFGELYGKVTSTLTKGENVCISVIPGCGEKTIYNFLSYNIAKNNLFGKIYVYDPELETDDLLSYTKKLDLRDSSTNILLIIRFFERIEDKSQVLERLDSIRRHNPKILTYLAISNQDAVLYPSSHQAVSTVFFANMIYVSPFDLVQSEKMISSLINYYGWKLNSKDFDQIYKLSGGIPRLIKYLIKENYESHINLVDLKRLTKIPQIEFQLRLLVRLLCVYDKSEIQTLGLTDGKFEIKSKLLRYYLKTNRSEVITKLYPQLSVNETRILAYFYENQEKVLTLDNLANVMNMCDDNFSLWGIYKTISRIRPKIKNNFKIKNFKGRGYKLESSTVSSR